jgi:predicted ATP-dependent endonuclease of OLD family
MKISEIKIDNFRSFKNETINLDCYNCLVGPNGCGKSTVLTALNIFFRNTVPNMNVANLSKEDFHHGNISNPVRITITFDDLSSEAKEDFKEYFRQDKLIISAVAEWDSQSQSAPVKQVGSRLVMSDFVNFFGRMEAGAKAKELEELYNGLRKKFKDLPIARSMADKAQSLRNYEESHKELCVLKESTQEFYGFTRGAGRLPKYIQWVFIPAVKDVSTEQEESRKTALGQLLERTVRTKVNFKDQMDGLKSKISEEYKKIVENEKDALKSLSASLENRLRQWSHPGTKLELYWNYDEDKSISINDPIVKMVAGEDKFIGEISRLGHGVQRSLLIALLQELAVSDDTLSPRLLLGFEEPELYQHPPQAYYMSELLEKLSKGNSQILITTHSPYFIPSKGFEDVKAVRKINCESRVTTLSISDLNKKLAVALGKTPISLNALVVTVAHVMQPSLNELFFARIPILVEGTEDVGFVSTYFYLMEKWIDVRRLGLHFVVASGKNNMSRPLAIAQGFSMSVFAIFDGDVYNEKERDNNVRDYSCILKLCSVKKFDPLSKIIIIEANVVNVA